MTTEGLAFSAHVDISRLMTTDLQGYRVLVVEDDAFVADELAGTIKEAGGHVVGPFTNVHQVAETKLDGKVDVAILDIDLGGELSFTVADALAKENVPFVFASGKPANSIPFRHGERTLIEKPYRIDDLVAIVAALVKSSKTG